MSSWIKNNFWIFFFSIFATVGTLLGIAGGLIWWKSESLIARGIRTEGRVVRLFFNGSSATALIEYDTDWGETRSITTSISSSPSGYEVGEKVAVWYDPLHPERVQVDGLERWFLPLLFHGFFLVFGGIGWGGIVSQILKKRRRRWLLVNGITIQAGQVEVGRNHSIKMNGVSPFVVRCQWHDSLSNKVYTFQSDPIWFDPSAYITGPTLPVLIDPRNPKNYFIDLSFLPEAA